MKKRLYVCITCKELDRPLPMRLCKGCKKLKADAFYLKNKDKYTAWRKSWRENNPERVKEIRRVWTCKYYKLHPDKAQAKYAHKRLWAKNNPNKRLIIARNWRTKNPDKYLQGRKTQYSRAKYGHVWEAHRVLLNLAKTIRKEVEYENESIECEEIKGRALGNTSRLEKKKARSDSR